MIGYLTKLKIDERKELIDLVNEKSGITGVALEKDWWVTITLKALFNSEYSKYIVFKGGTSLSKCYKLIDRFSEDIDIVIDPNAFGWEYETEPSNSFVKRLKRAGSEFTRTELLESIKKELDKIGVPENEYEILAKEIDPKMPDIDPQILYINYKSIFDYNPYLPPNVKIEVGVRSNTEPNEKTEIISLLNEYHNIEVIAENPFPIFSLKPQRTFLEKIFLLHERFNTEIGLKMNMERTSRHYYDLYKMHKYDFALDAINNVDFIESLVNHRCNYIRLKDFNYDELKKGNINIIPNEKLLNEIEDDYKTMQTEMIYNESPSFKELVEHMKKLQNLYNN